MAPEKQSFIIATIYHDCTQTPSLTRGRVTYKAWYAFKDLQQHITACELDLHTGNKRDSRLYYFLHPCHQNKTEVNTTVTRKMMDWLPGVDRQSSLSSTSNPVTWL